MTLPLDSLEKEFRSDEETLPWGDRFEKQVMNNATLRGIGWYFEERFILFSQTPLTVH